MKTILALICLLFGLAASQATPTIDYFVDLGFEAVTGVTFTAGTIGVVEISLDGVNWNLLDSYGRIGKDGGSRVVLTPGSLTGFPMYLIRLVEYP